MSSMQPIRYETGAGMRDAGGENNTSDEATCMKLGHSHEHYLCHTFQFLSVLTMVSLLAYS